MSVVGVVGALGEEAGDGRRMLSTLKTNGSI